MAATYYVYCNARMPVLKAEAEARGAPLSPKELRARVSSEWKAQKTTEKAHKNHVLPREEMSQAKTVDEAVELRRAHLIRKNTEDLLHQCDTSAPELLKKIETFRLTRMNTEDRAMHPVDELLLHIRSNPTARALFLKDPVRQKLGEDAQLEMLCRRVPDLVRGESNRGGIVFADYKLHTLTGERPPACTKTLDAFSPTLQRYYILKYTTTSGGAQDNQYNDVLSFLRQSIGYLSTTPTATESFEFVLNGSYYTEAKRSALVALIPAGLSARIVIASA